MIRGQLLSRKRSNFGDLFRGDHVQSGQQFEITLDVFAKLSLVPGRIEDVIHVHPRILGNEIRKHRITDGVRIQRNLSCYEYHQETI